MTFNVGDRVMQSNLSPFKDSRHLWGTVEEVEGGSGANIRVRNDCGTLTWFVGYELVNMEIRVGDTVVKENGTPFSHGHHTAIVSRIDVGGNTRGDMVWIEGGSWLFRSKLRKVTGTEPEVVGKFKVGDKVWFSSSISFTNLPVGTVEGISKSSWAGVMYKISGINSMPESKVNLYDEALINPFSPGDMVSHDGNVFEVGKVEDQFITGIYGQWIHFSEAEVFTPCEVVSKWGKFEYVHHDNRRLVYFLPHKLALHCYAPEIEEEDEKLKVSLYLNRAEYERGRRTTLKVGRAIRMLYPEFSDKEVQALVDKINARFTPRVYTLHTGTQASDFVHAYTHKQSPYENPRTTSHRKCLADSCMRYDFVKDGFSHHPVEAYASGDFMIIWTEDKEGKIGSRAVVSTHGDAWVAGPVYGVCEKSMDMIEKHVVDNCGHLFIAGKNWEGARVVKIPDRDRFIGPFFDSTESLRDAGDYFVVDDFGGIGTGNHMGHFESGPECYECVARADTHNENGESFCEDCYNDLYTFCEIGDYEIRRVDAIEVCQYSWNRRVTSIIVDSEGDSYSSCEYSAELWVTEDMVEDYDGNLVSPEYANNNMTVCEVSDKYCDNDDIVKVRVDNDVQFWHKDELSSDHEYNEERDEYYERIAA
jgi:hypothetical protein